MYKRQVGSHVVKGLGVDFLGIDDEIVIVDYLDALPEVGVVAGVGLIFPGVLHRSDHVGRRHHLAVMELDVVADRELPLLVGKCLILLDYARDRLKGLDIRAEEVVVGKQDVYKRQV